MSIAYEKATECAACGGILGEKRYGRYDDFCSVECRKVGRGFCKLCGVPITQPRMGSRDFCSDLCKNRFYSRGRITPSLIEEMHRSTCKGCGEPMSPATNKKNIKLFCSNACRLRYKRTKEYGLSLRERWGSYAPETRKAICEVEDVMGKAMATRLAIAIDREYAPRRKVVPASISQSHYVYGKPIRYICKGCGKEFSRKEFSPLSKDYCTNMCQLKAEGYDGYHGEKSPNAKFTWEQIHEIRALYATGQVSFHTLAEKYHVGDNTISHIIHCRTWKPEHDPRHKEQP